MTWLLACYLAVEACAGVLRPPPRILVRPGATVACPGLARSGRCHGAYYPARKLVVLPLDDASALAHEYLHHLIGDRRHRDARWGACPRACAGIGQKGDK